MKKAIITVAAIVLSLCLVFLGLHLYLKFNKPSPQDDDNSDIGEVIQTQNYTEEYSLYDDINPIPTASCIVIPSYITDVKTGKKVLVPAEYAFELEAFSVTREYNEPMCKCMHEYVFECESGEFSFNITSKYARHEEGQVKLSDAQTARITQMLSYIFE